MSGNKDVGGLTGQNHGNWGDASNSFWDIKTSDLKQSDGGIGLTTSEMQMKSTFTEAGWDFEDTWYMKNYPDLQWNR